MTQQSHKELTLSLQRLKKQLHRIRYTKIREAQLFLMNNKLLDNEASDFPSGAISEKNIDRVFFSDKGVVKNRIDEFMVVHSEEEVD